MMPHIRIRKLSNKTFCIGQVLRVKSAVHSSTAFVVKEMICVDTIEKQKRGEHTQLRVISLVDVFRHPAMWV